MPSRWQQHTPAGSLDSMKNKQRLLPAAWKPGSVGLDFLPTMLLPSPRLAACTALQVEFGAHQVILMRSKASDAGMPESLRSTRALRLTVPAAKGLEVREVLPVLT